MRLIISIGLIFFLLSLNSFSYPRYSSDEDTKDQELFFVIPNNGEEVTSPFKVEFGLIGMDVVPAGIDKPMSGHHHLLIDVKKLPDMKAPIPADKNHLHFGKGQKEAMIELPKGKHTLQLLLGNYLHVPHDKPLISERIEIIVK
jgi:hypothetical protein